MGAESGGRRGAEEGGRGEEEERRRSSNDLSGDSGGGAGELFLLTLLSQSENGGVWSRDSGKPETKWWATLQTSKVQKTRTLWVSTPGASTSNSSSQYRA